MSYSITEVENHPDCKQFKNNNEKLYVEVKFDKTYKQISFPSDYVYHPCLMYKKYKDWVEKYQEFKVREDDVWIVGFPKSGTTWMSNVVHALVHGVEAGHIKLRTEYFEAPLVYNKSEYSKEHHNMIEDRDKILDEIDALTTRRIIKSHSPAHLLPKDIWVKKPTIIYIEREVKDAAVSAYNTSTRMPAIDYSGPPEKIYELIYKDFIPFGPYYYHWHSYKQLKGVPDMPKMFFTSYEELKKNTKDIVKSIGEFLNVKNLTEEVLEKIVNHVSFENMRSEYNNGNSFLCNGGKTGSYDGVMSQDVVKEFDTWTKNKMEEIKDCKQPTIC